MAQYALNLRPEANLHWSALPTIAPWLYPLLAASTPERLAATARAARPLIERCIRRARGADGRGRHPRHDPAHRLSALPPLGRRRWRPRSPRTRATCKTYGVNFRARRRARAGRAGAAPAGPQGRRRADARARQRGGSRRRREGLRRACSRSAAGASSRAMRARCAPLRSGWQVRTAEGPIAAGAVVVALGPWSDDVLPPARHAPAARRQARLSHAFQAAGQCHAQPARHRRRRTAMR